LDEKLGRCTKKSDIYMHRKNKLDIAQVGYGLQKSGHDGKRKPNGTQALRLVSESSHWANSNNHPGKSPK